MNALKLNPLKRDERSSSRDVDLLKFSTVSNAL